MKKIIVILLIIFFSLNSAIITSYFYFKKSEIKKEMKNIIANNKNISAVEKLTIDPRDKNFRKIEDNEFIYNGKLYDIIEEFRLNGKLIFFCINDKKEEALLKDFSLIEFNSELFNSNLTINKVLSYSFIPLFLKVLSSFHIPKKILFYNQYEINHYPSIKNKPTVPPPKC